MLLEQMVYTTWCSKNRQHLEQNGYIFTKFGDRVEIKADHLTDSSKVIVKISCDLCDNVYNKTYQNWRVSYNLYGRVICKYCLPKSNRNRIEDVISIFKSKGYTPLFTVYSNAFTKLKYICHKHPHIEQYIRYNDITNGQGCYLCGIDKKSGERHHNWKGGITPEHLSIRTSREYNLWRNEVFKRDSYTCVKCNEKSTGNLHGHHISSFSTDIKNRLNVDNGITLCETCHKRFHMIFGIINNTSEQIYTFLS